MRVNGDDESSGEVPTTGIWLFWTNNLNSSRLFWPECWVLGGAPKSSNTQTASSSSSPTPPDYWVQYILKWNAVESDVVCLEGGQLLHKSEWSRGTCLPRYCLASADWALPTGHSLGTQSLHAASWTGTFLHSLSWVGPLIVRFPILLSYRSGLGNLACLDLEIQIFRQSQLLVRPTRWSL